MDWIGLRRMTAILYFQLVNYKRVTIPALPRLKVTIRIVGGTQFTSWNIHQAWIHP